MVIALLEYASEVDRRYRMLKHKSVHHCKRTVICLRYGYAVGDQHWTSRLESDLSTNILTQWSRNIFEKLIVTQLVEKFPASLHLECGGTKVFRNVGILHVTLRYHFTLRMEAARSSETLVSYLITSP